HRPGARSGSHPGGGQGRMGYRARGRGPVGPRSQRRSRRRMITGLKPRGFTWVIANRLAVSERIGGHGFQHRRVRREEEINWLVREAGITSVVTLLAGNQNKAAYEAAGLKTHTVPISGDPARIEPAPLFETLDRLLADPDARILVHREIIDDVIGGLLGG